MSDEKEPKTVVKAFRITQVEDEKLTKIVEYCHKAGYIPTTSMQDFMVFCLNCAYKQLEPEITRRAMISRQRKAMGGTL